MSRAVDTYRGHSEEKWLSFYFPIYCICCSLGAVPTTYHDRPCIDVPPQETSMIHTEGLKQPWKLGRAFQPGQALVAARTVTAIPA